MFAPERVTSKVTLAAFTVLDLIFCGYMKSKAKKKRKKKA